MFCSRDGRVSAFFKVTVNVILDTDIQQMLEDALSAHSSMPAIAAGKPRKETRTMCTQWPVSASLAFQPQQNAFSATNQPHPCAPSNPFKLPKREQERMEL